MILDRVREYILVNNLIEENEKVLIAFSGGTDSLALLGILQELREALHIELGACHVNHMLRGKDAEEDEAFCRETAERLSIPFYSTAVDVHAHAEEKGMSFEAAGREIRYAFFKEIMVNHNYEKCATAHHLDDQVETVLLNLMRGSGLNGLTGMSSKREQYIKPLLFLKKEELSAYLEDHQMIPREDDSNRISIYQRNKVRNELIPYIRENFNEDFPETIWRMSELLKEDLDYIQRQMGKMKSLYVREGKNRSVVIEKDAFREPKAMVTRLLFDAISSVKGDLSDIEEVHIKDMIALQTKETGKLIDIKDAVIARNDYGNLIIERKKTDTEREEEMLHEELKIPGTYVVDGKTIRFRFVERDQIVKDKKLRFFNGDLMEETVIVRNRQEGDRMRPFGMNGYRKLKNILIDKKISREDRDRLLIFQNRNDVFYIGSMIISDDYKVKDSTEKILEIGIFEEEAND
ncbi:tRNA lysidine(34) synthetase TilS [Proteiniclasticum sp. C24MP]|uniref:tRNA lysidine(34) synthetase TilS n=1 Tax=Proteiniclasticum sp. C24MP TaxID=3374101 RepID=UPI003754FEC1